DVLVGGDGNDLIVGAHGNDTAQLGAGNDTFVWNQGDGSDVVDGQDGTDTLVFNGATGGENIDISANGSGVRMFRALGNITMDLSDIEHIQVTPLGGADTITVNNLSGTDVTEVNVDLGGAGDGQADTVVINATDRNDVIRVVNHNGVVTVTGLATEVSIRNFETNDRIVINGLGGNDVIDASRLTGMLFTASGGDGNDVLVGSAGDDVLNGEAGNDHLIGGGGHDTLDGGPGHNTVTNSAAHCANAASLLNQFMASTFVMAGAGHGGTPIADPQTPQQSLLTQPHA